MALQNLLDEIIGEVNALPRQERRRLLKMVGDRTKKLAWVPNPGPQTEAFYSEADELGYGGEAGGGKSQLIIGLSLTEHRRSLLLRRTNKEAEKFVDEIEAILGHRKGWNGKKQTWTLPDHTIDTGGCQLESDKQKRKGNPHDLIGFDQVEDFTETQYTFIIGWNRSVDKNQRCRVVANFNPPTKPEGLWVVRRWAAWLDPRHPRPAKSGELRWYTTINGKDTEVDGPGPHMIDGEPIMAKSRTFIHATLSDNPELETTGYGATLAAMPEDLRLAYKGGSFEDSLRDNPRQLIPTSWIREAQMRWTEKPPVGVPMCAIAADCSGGGRDPLAICWRHDGWFSPIEITEGKDLPQDKIGRWTAGAIVAARRDRATVIVDLGGGYGSAAYEHLRTNLDGGAGDLLPAVVGYKGSAATTERTRPDQQLSFRNVRTKALWRLREALDPGQVGGSPIALPDDPEMVADLTAVTFWVEGSTIVAESKEDVCERLGRSTDKGDVVIMCWSAGATASTDGAMWEQQQRQARYPMGRRPQVINKPSRDRR